MKNYMKLVNFFFLIMLTSCGQHKSSVEGGFLMEMTNIKLDSIKIPPVLFKERKIVSNDDFLVSINIDSDTIFRVFAFPDFKYLGAFGSKGKGPDDYDFPNISTLNFDRNGLVTADRRELRILEVTNFKSLINDSLIFKTRIKKPGRLLRTNYDFLLSENSFCGVEILDAQKQLICYNNVTNEITHMFDFPTYSDEEFPETALANLYTRRTGISYDKSKIALLYGRFPMLNIYNVNSGEVITSVLDKAPSQKEVRVGANQRTVNGAELISYYSSIQTTDKYIYGLYQARERFVLEKVTGSGNVGTRNLTDLELHIYDWEGQAIMKIKLEPWMTVFTPAMNDELLIFVHPEVEDKLYLINIKMSQ